MSAIAERTGLEKCTFEKDTRKEPAKEKEKKGKSSTKGSSVPIQTAPTSTESEYTSSLPLLTDNGQPVFVIIEFEVHHPLQPARSLVDLTNCIDKMLHSYTLSPNPYTSVLAEEHYSNCIKKLVDTLCGAYQEFLADTTIPNNFKQSPQNVSSPMKMFGRDKKTSDNMERPLCDKVIMESINKQGDCKYTYIKDEIACFVQYLHETGLYVSVRSTLKNKIIMLLDQKFKIEMPTLSKNECQNFVATAYIYLVEQMHCTLNKFVEGRYATDATNSSAIPYLSFVAEESLALGCIIDARKTYSSIIDNDRKNPDTWLEYAIFLIRIGDLERAMECCREAIILDRQHKIGLLLYGVLLSHNENYPDAEIFLQIVTQLYPQFAEGWAILHLFYLRTEFSAGADVTIQVAQKCLQDDAPDTITTGFLKRDPLPWTRLTTPKDRIYLVSVTLLLKLSCLDFAGIALAQELSEVGRTRHFLYLMAVQHYMQSRYADAICHLKEAVDLDGMDYSLASLLGHCHEEEGNFDEAIYCYEFANTLFNRPEDLHLAQLR
ncbi:uncharacterized protein LOC105693995 [Athalia rosae]|uniref:uncharacterized protein LOC105693995 n=1 Tax=Athalia rosae TaxID=37344 RepID=UPI0020346BE5|nr:uncharacterized protein LOC105693995 [Athalia rosae]